MFKMLTNTASVYCMHITQNNLIMSKCFLCLLFGGISKNQKRCRHLSLKNSEIYVMVQAPNKIHGCLGSTDDFWQHSLTQRRCILTTITHIETLQRKRHSLKTAIRQEMQSPNFDELKVHSMKKRNLLLKDEIALLHKRAS